MRQHTWTLVAVAIMAGCSQNGPTNTPQGGGRSDAKSSDPDAAAKESWAKFVGRAKGNIPKAIADSKGKVSDGVEIDWVSDDVKKSTSVKYPYEGTARVRSVHVSSLRANFDHTMRFGYEDGRWVFLGGQEVNDSRSFELKSLRFIYLRTMFEQ